MGYCKALYSIVLCSIVLYSIVLAGFNVTLHLVALDGGFFMTGCQQVNNKRH